MKSFYLKSFTFVFFKIRKDHIIKKNKNGGFNMPNKKDNIHETGCMPGSKKIRFRRPEIWENKSVEEIKNAFLNILEKEGISFLVKNFKGEHSEITEFLEKNKKYSYEEIEEIIIRTLKENLNEIAEFIFDNHSANLIITDPESSLCVWIRAGMYSWPDEDVESDWYYKYYYFVSISK